jgi:tetratricopeptide (TPR) repeat protein
MQSYHFCQRSRFLKLIITISFTTLNTYYLIGQQKKDSLIQVARSFEIEDTVRFNILRNLSATSSDLDDKLSYGQELFAQAKKSNDIKWQAFAKILSGTAYRLKSDLSLALTEYLEAANLAKSIDHEIGLGQSYLNMADVYSIIDNHDGAIRYYHQAILVLKKSANYRALSAALVNLGDHYFNQNQPDSALFYFETVQQYDAYTTVLQKAYNLGNIGLVNAQLGKYDLAENRINEASRSLSVLKEFYPVCVYLTYLADIYASKGETERAINFTKESLRTSLEYGFKEQIRDAYKKLNSLYAAKGDIENAYFNHLQYVIYKDSVSNLESVQKMADLQTQFEVGQKQTEVDLLTAEKRTQQIITWAIAAFALILIVLAAININTIRQRPKST